MAGLATAFVLGSTLAVLAVRWINPPVTPLMVTQLFHGMLEGRWVGIHRSWMPLGRMSPALLRSVIAAEDAHFFTHWGVDLEALRRARAWNLRHHQRGHRRIDPPHGEHGERGAQDERQRQAGHPLQHPPRHAPSSSAARRVLHACL